MLQLNVKRASKFQWRTSNVAWNKFLFFFNGFVGSRYAGNRFSITPYITPRLTPHGTPKVISTAGSPKGYSAAGSPKKTSGATSPSKLPYEGRQSLSSWYPSSQQSSAANSPPRTRSLTGLEDLLLFHYKIYSLHLDKIGSWRTIISFFYAPIIGWNLIPPSLSFGHQNCFCLEAYS